MTINYRIMLRISEIQINYMGKTCTAEDFVKFCDSPQKCDDLNKIGAIVYLSKIHKELRIAKNHSIDQICEIAQENYDKIRFIVLSLIKVLGLKEVPEIALEIFNTDDNDKQYQLLYKLCNKLRI